MPDIIAMSLAVASTVAASIGMILFKKAAGTGVKKMFLSRNFMLGGIIFVLGTVLMILALQREELSVVFPVTSLTYIWVMLLSKKFLNEEINKWKLLSVIFIVTGIILVTT